MKATHKKSIKMKPMTLTTGIQPILSDLLTYSHSTEEATFAYAGQDLANMYSFGFSGRDFSLDNDPGPSYNCCIL
jgi:hypothetical protein